MTVRALLDEMEEQQLLAPAAVGQLTLVPPTDWSAPSGDAAPFRPPIRVIPLDSVREELESLHRWATTQIGSGALTFGEVLSLPDNVLPPDVLEARARICSTPLADCVRSSAMEFVRAMLDELDERVRQILVRRRWQAEPPTLAELGEELDITRERVRQVQLRGQRDVENLLSKHHEVRWLVFDAQRRLGPWLPRALAEASMSELGLQIDSLECRVVLDLAGPYVDDGAGWFLRESDDIRSAAIALLLSSVDSDPSVTTAELVVELASLGLRTDAAAAYLQREPHVRQFGECWVRWTGNAVDKAEKVLRLAGEPLTADEVTARIGEGHSKGTVQNGMSTDDRFVRTSRRAWGLREWRIEEYSGIVEEIFERIDRHGGSCSVEGLTAELTAAFGVSVNSIQLYLGTLAFVVNDGWVRRRTKMDPWPAERRLAFARGAYRTSEGLRLCVRASRDVLRGSGQPIHPAVASALGVAPGTRRDFVGPTGDVVQIGWRTWSTTGPDIGSTRALAVQAAASEGDEIVLAFNVHDSTVRPERINGSLTGVARLTSLAGLNVSDDIESQLARSIDCERSEVRATLRSRGDGAVADLLSADVDERLQAAIESLLSDLE